MTPWFGKLLNFTGFVHFTNVAEHKRWAWVFRTSFFIDYYNNWNGFNNNKNTSFFFVSIETLYRFIGFLLKTPARPEHKRV